MSTAAKQDAAQQAYSLGFKAFKGGDLNRAIKYLRKSLSYHNSREARRLLFKAEWMKKQGNAEEKKSSTRHDAPSTNSQIPTEEKAKSSVNDPEIQRVLRENDYYKLLGVERNFSNEKILIKKYRKLAMKLHPDRNQLPGAEDAFKKISTAYECLKDPPKRRQYDRGGMVNTQVNRMRTEDIIRMFFENGHGFNFPNQQREEEDLFHEPGRATEQSVWNRVLSLLPILLILVYSLLPETNMLRPEDPFSLERTVEYTVARVHSRTEIPFYVNRKFSRQVQNNPDFLRRVEDKVEGKYLRKLAMACKVERAARKNRIAEASEVRGEDMVKSLRDAHEGIDPSCVMFDDYIGSS